MEKGNKNILLEEYPISITAMANDKHLQHCCDGTETYQKKITTMDIATPESREADKI
jgi:hypothetical protein